MTTIRALIFFTIGLCLVTYFADKLVKAVVGTSLGFGILSFLLSVILCLCIWRIFLVSIGINLK